MTEEMGHIILGHLEHIDAQVKEIAKTLREINHTASCIDDGFSELEKELIKARENSLVR